MSVTVQARAEDDFFCYALQRDADLDSAQQHEEGDSDSLFHPVQGDPQDLVYYQEGNTKALVYSLPYLEHMHTLQLPRASDE